MKWLMRFFRRKRPTIEPGNIGNGRAAAEARKTAERELADVKKGRAEAHRVARDLQRAQRDMFAEGIQRAIGGP